MSKKCCFIGHRKIDKSTELENRLYNEIEKLIHEGVDTFLFGSKSEFDSLCHLIVSDLKEIYPHIKRVYVRAEYSDITDDYRKYLLKSYEDTYYPEKIRNSGRASYVERNQYMINQCLVCIVYYKDDYLPPRRKKSKADLIEYQPRSGTRVACEYAKNKGKRIINVEPYM